MTYPRVAHPLWGGGFTETFGIHSAVSHVGALTVAHLFWVVVVHEYHGYTFFTPSLWCLYVKFGEATGPTQGGAEFTYPN